MKKIFILSLFIFNTAYASKSLSAHNHGSVAIDFATDKKSLLVMIKGPGESFFGFEHKPKNEEQIKLVNTIKESWKQNAIKLIDPKSLNDCKQTSSNWSQHFEGDSHSEIEAEVYIDCKKMVSGRNLNIFLMKKFSNIKVLSIQILRENGTTFKKSFKEKEIKIKL